MGGVQEAATETPEKVEFFSRYADTVYVLRSEIHKAEGPLGLVTKIPSIEVQFKGGRLEITADERGRALANGELVHDELTFEDLVEWFRRHEDNGRDYREHIPPPPMLPTVEDLNLQIMEAVRDQNPEALEAIRKNEQETHGREAVLKAVDAALNTLVPPDAVAA